MFLTYLQILGGAALVIAVVLAIAFFTREQETIHEKLTKNEFLQFARIVESEMEAKGFPCHLTLNDKIIKLVKDHDEKVSEAVHNKLASWECTTININATKRRICTRFNKAVWKSILEALAKIKASRDNEKTIVMSQNKPSKCVCCGAPLVNNKCDYCGVTYK